MEYKLFDDYITLQALLKELGIIQSGGAIKAYLAETTVLFNGEDEKRRGKKIRLGDVVSIPEDAITIDIIAPTDEEKKEHLEALAEKVRVAAIVKELNAKNKKDKKQNQAKKQTKPTKERKPVRFPGT
ncbi:S4 domain-containing protein YaaA [Streptococcus infantarius]|uniref:S4 domain-containing protein YaaA n=1 Tax=Streptococcus infantarius TaxID=102684 RepID=UPI00208FA56F|nr:S4 domain-containing protein YaaA [Streptococcus infantarius]MCO4481060.1 S4 domain protein YaaA [Streptococcus infantarius subsp. infantarius]MCO4483029.1 S4 domain protein YaaA [Streptococcus infantarius subsp. infantarius]MCO4487039.1 S4 domain protein YaaA [Streptococcus infantarius subsp. infantarius]MCO4493905.1 S4 domain protein YaaA [Streptococcus infantarius subsp. infantarius]MCO4495912.1 S4 domain protein YaaA [Streptococcus infantarius subsp. infantarius]